jgi:hypothetical protein
MIQTKHLLIGVAVVFLSSCAANRQQDIIGLKGQSGILSSVESPEDKLLTATIHDLMDFQLFNRAQERRLRRMGGAPPGVHENAKLAKDSVCSDETFQNALLALRGVISQRFEALGEEWEVYDFWSTATPAEAFNIDPQTLEGWPDPEVPESK